MQTVAAAGDLGFIFEQGKQEEFGKGDIILRPNRPSENVYYVRAGFIEVYTINGRGDRTVHVVYGPGDMFPIAWTFDGKRRDPYCKALTDTTLSTIGRRAFTQLVNADLTANKQYTFQVLKQFGVYVNQVTNLQLARNRERLLCSLLYFGDRFGKRTDDTLRIEAPLTQEVIARSINMTRESVSRQMSLLKSEGVIATEPNGFVSICALGAVIAAVADYIDISVLSFL